MKDKKGIIITNAFQKVLKESNLKPNKIWTDKGSRFCNISMTSWLRKNAIEMYSTRNEEKSVVAEKFIGTLNNKLYKFVTLIQKMCILKKQMT